MANRTPSPWVGLAALLLPVTLMTADLGVLWLATPDLAADLGPSSSQLLWITDAYGFMTCGFLLVMGALGDRIGRRRLLVFGCLGIAAASLIAAYASNPETLIAARAVLGVAGAAVLPSTLSLITHLFTDPRQRARAIALWVTALSTGIAIGPVIGGILLQHWWWGSVFLIGVPVVALSLPAVLLLVPEYRAPHPGRFDLPSVLLFLLAVLPVVYGVKKAAESGVAPAHALPVLVGAGFALLFVRRQHRLPTPLIDLRLFGDRAFTGALLTLLLGMMALNSIEYLVPQFLLNVSELSPLAAGLWLLPSAAGLVVGSQLTPLLTRRVRPAYVIAVGVVLTVPGFWLIAVAGAGDGGVWGSALGSTLVMFGVAPVSVLGTGLAMGAAPAEKAGAASGAGQTAYDLGLALGIAVTGSVSVAIYRAELNDALPAGLSAETAHTARDSVGSAASAAETLPQPLAEQLLGAARDAFTTGFHATAAVGAGLALVTAAVALLMLRHVPTEAAGTAEAAGAPETVDAAAAAGATDAAEATGGTEATDTAAATPAAEAAMTPHP